MHINEMEEAILVPEMKTTNGFTLTSIEFAERDQTFMLDRRCLIRCNVFMYRVYNKNVFLSFGMTRECPHVSLSPHCGKGTAAFCGLACE